MNNTRYDVSEGSVAARTATVGVAAAGAVVLVLNALRLVGVIPDLLALRLLAPLGATFAMLALVGITWLLRPRSARAAAAVTVTGMAAVVATAALVVIEVVTHYVLSYLADGARAEVLAGPLHGFLIVASFGFIVAILAFCATLVIGRLAPWPPLVPLAVGAVLLGLRTMLPEVLSVVGLVALAAGILWVALSVTRSFATVR